MTIRSNIFRACLTVTVVSALLSCGAPRIPQQESLATLPAGFGVNRAPDHSALQAFPIPAPLKTLLDTVLAGNADLKIAAERMAAARAVMMQTKGMSMPTVGVGAVPSMRRFGLYTMDGAGNKTTDIEPGKTVPVNLPDLYLGFQASWEVDLWGKWKSRRKAAATRLLASEEGRRLITTALMSETAGAYYELVAADQTLNLLDETIRIQEQALEMVRVQKQAAVVNELAVQQFEAQVLDLRGMREDVLRGIHMNESRIRMLAGRYEMNIPRDTASFVTQAPPVMRYGVPTDLLRNRPDIRQAELELQATRFDLQAARAAFYPTLQITGSAGLQAYNAAKFLLFPESIAYGLFAGLSAPLLNRSRIKGDFAIADAAQREAFLQYGKQVNRAYQEVQLELDRMEHLENMHQYKKQQTAILQSSTAISIDLFRTGRAAYLEVLLARQNALRANMELIAARKEQYLAAVNLYRALGGGN